MSLRKHFYLLIFGVFFLGGCLFFDNSSDGNNVTLEKCKTDLDCGGRTCTNEGTCKEKVPVGQPCQTDNECESKSCLVVCVPQSECDSSGTGCDLGEICVEGSCEGEPCGSSETKLCEESQPCGDDNDCMSGNCLESNVCGVNTCENGRMDGDEEGIDCGNGCLKCPGKPCVVDADCLSGLCEDVSTLGKICVVDSCEDVARGLAPIKFTKGVGKVRSNFCDGEGWALLGRSKPDSDWKSGGVLWRETPAVGGLKPSLKGSFQTHAYAGLKTKAIKLCYKNINSCFEFVHNGEKPLAEIISSNPIILQESNLQESNLQESKIQDFLTAMGFKVIAPKEEPLQIKCFRLGINPAGLKSGIGLIGDISPCTESSVFDDLALGLGLSTMATTSVNEPLTAGNSRYVEPVDNNVTVGAPNSKSIGPWFIFGK